MLCLPFAQMHPQALTPSISVSINDCSALALLAITNNEALANIAFSIFFITFSLKTPPPFLLFLLLPTITIRTNTYVVNQGSVANIQRP